MDQESCGFSVHLWVGVYRKQAAGCRNRYIKLYSAGNTLYPLLDWALKFTDVSHTFFEPKNSNLQLVAMIDFY